MSELRTSTQSQVDGAFDARTVAILPTGSTEPHGPHLPIETDVILAQALAEETASQLEELGVRALVLPPIAYGVTRLAQDFDGGVTLRPGTLWALVEDMLLSLRQDGICQLLCCNAHHEWEQRRTLLNLATDYVRRGAGECQLIVPDDPRARLEEIECHGGRRETSLMLAVAPERVRVDLLSDLPEVSLELPLAEPGKNRSLLKLGATAGYCGDPGAAQAVEGRELLVDLARAHVEHCERHWPDLFARG